MIFGGSVIVETVFAIPGIGRLLVSSIFGQDYVVVQAITFVIASIVDVPGTNRGNHEVANAL